MPNNNLHPAKAAKQPLTYVECIALFEEDRRYRELICHHEYTTGYRLIQHEFIRVVCALVQWNHDHSEPPTREQFAKIIEKCCH